MPSENKSRLYLASGSPRRREILENLGFEIIRLHGDIDETPQPNENAKHYVARMAREKNVAAQMQWQRQHTNAPDAPILTADTTVALDGEILGKPESAEHAGEILRRLSGRTHQVLTAVCLFSDGITHEIVQSSDVRFKDLSDNEILAYVATGEPLDKAGAYGIQGLAGVWVAHLHGSFTGVMGLPVFETNQLLAKIGFELFPMS